MLGVDDLAGEALAAGEARAVAFVVAVVAGAAVQEVACEERAADGRTGDGAGILCETPRKFLARELARGVADVAQYRRTVGHRLGLPPRPERVAKREHVRVRANAGVAEQVPGTPRRLSCLEDRERLLRAAPAQVTGRAHPRQAGADDQHVYVLGLHVNAP